MRKILAEDETVLSLIVPFMKTRTSVSDEDEEKMWAAITAHTHNPDCRDQLSNLYWAEIYCIRAWMEKWSVAGGFHFPSLEEWEFCSVPDPVPRERRLMEKIAVAIYIIKKGNYSDLKYNEEGGRRHEIKQVSHILNR